MARHFLKYAAIPNDEQANKSLDSRVRFKENSSLHISSKYVFLNYLFQHKNSIYPSKFPVTFFSLVRHKLCYLYAPTFANNFFIRFTPKFILLHTSKKVWLSFLRGSLLRKNSRSSFITAHFVHQCTLKQALIDARYITYNRMARTHSVGDRKSV